MPTDKLTDTAIRKARPADKPVMLSDGGGMYLELRPNGTRYWRLKYRIGGREKLLSLGVYPAVTLAEARKKREAARVLIALGDDPSNHRKVDKSTRHEHAVVQAMVAAGEPLPGSFEAVARRWHATHLDRWAPTYSNKVLRRLETEVFPHLGMRPVGEIEPPELLQVLRRCEARGVVETAHRVRETCSLVFRFAIAEGSATRDAARDLVGALKQHATKHFAAIIDPDRFGELLRAIDGYGHRGTPQVRYALKLAALVFLRPGQELRGARWEEFDLDAATWAVPAERMKRIRADKESGPPHVVPLSRQAVQVLRELQPITGHSALLFPGMRDHSKPISENTLNAALSAMGFDATEHRAHGFRASARTMAEERLGIDARVIDAQQAHAVSDPLGRAYNRTQFLDQRRELMQRWADYLDELRERTPKLSQDPEAKPKARVERRNC